MSFATYNGPWLEEMRAQKEHLARSGVYDKVKALLAEQQAHKTPMLPIPVLFDKQTFDELAEAGLLIASAQAKILQHLHRQHSRAELLRRFEIPEAWAWMVNWDVLLSGAYTISRVDVLPANDGYYFCEINPDSSVGGPEVADWLELYCNAAGWSLAEGMQSPQHAAVRLFRQVMEQQDLQRYVVCDWSTNRDNGYFGFDLLRGHMARALPGREVHHVYEDTYREAWLDPREGRRTLVHRGFMYGDMNDEGAFLRRMCDSGATIINMFETEVRMHKSWFAMFCDPGYHPLLTANEVAAIKKYIPPTVAVSRDNLEDLLHRKAELVFKLNASWGGSGVLMGAEHSIEALRAALEAQGVERWSAQKLIVFDGIDLPFTTSFEFTRHNVVLGLYLHEGIASGLMLRASSRSKIVNIASGTGGYGWAVPVTPDQQARHLAALRRART